LCLLITTGQLIFESLIFSFECIDTLVFLFKRGFEFVDTLGQESIFLGEIRLTTC